MAHLATCLRYHIAAKQNTDPLWKNVSLISYTHKTLLINLHVAQGHPL